MMLFDASAVLAYLFAEPGGEKVKFALSGSAVTTVNMIEVARRLRRRLNDSQVQTIYNEFVSKLLMVEEVRHDDILTASRISQSFQKSHGISLGGACCMAVGMRLNAEVWTADAMWAKLPGVGRIKLIR